MGPTAIRSVAGLADAVEFGCDAIHRSEMKGRFTTFARGKFVLVTSCRVAQANWTIGHRNHTDEFATHLFTSAG
jgi:hypothetical protein